MCFPPPRGAASAAELLDVVKRASDQLELWTFERNAPARRFYEARGCVLLAIASVTVRAAFHREGGWRQASRRDVQAFHPRRRRAARLSARPANRASPRRRNPFFAAAHWAGAESCQLWAPNGRAHPPRRRSGRLRSRPGRRRGTASRPTQREVSASTMRSSRLPGPSTTRPRRGPSGSDGCPSISRYGRPVRFEPQGDALGLAGLDCERVEPVGLPAVVEPVEQAEMMAVQLEHGREPAGVLEGQHDGAAGLGAEGGMAETEKFAGRVQPASGAPSATSNRRAPLQVELLGQVVGGQRLGGSSGARRIELARYREAPDRARLLAVMQQEWVPDVAASTKASARRRGPAPGRRCAPGMARPAGRPGPSPGPRGLPI